METCKDLIPYKSFPWHGKVILPLFIISGSILFAVTIGLHNNAKANFNCNPDKNIAADVTQKTFIQTSCLSKYEEKYNSPIPLHWYIILSFGLVVLFSLVYAVGVKSRVEKFDTSVATTNDIELQPLQQSSESGHRLNRRSHVPVLYIYIAQLVFARIIPTTLFASLVFFRAYYPTEFSCFWSSPSSNITDSIRDGNLSSKCTSLIGSHYKASAMAAGIVNTVCPLLALPELIYLLWKVCCQKLFGSDREFCSFYLLGKNKAFHAITEIYKRRLRTDKNIFKMDIHYEKKGTLDQMYVPLIIQTGRRYDVHDEEAKRHQIYDTYLEVPHTSVFVEDIQDLFENTENPPHTILVIGRPGIGKSIFAKKLLFNWTKEACLFCKEKILILFKFRYFNSEENKFKSLKEMLRIGIGVPAHDNNFDSFFKFVLANPKEVFLIFDGLDELKVDSDCLEVAEDSPDDCWESMSVFSIWNKLISGKFLPGATVITTSRPTVDHLYSNLPFDKTLEILGFTKPRIQKYVENFFEKREVEHEVIWSSIEGSAELLSLCYVPVNNYIVCLTLERCLEGEASIPRTLTELYKRAIRILLWDHHPACKIGIKKKDYLNSNSYFPEEIIELLDKLKTLALKGMEKNQLIFNQENISDVIENCMSARIRMENVQVTFNQEELSGIENCGLFNSLPNEDESQFCFLHLTLQEYLAAWKLVDDCNGPDDVERVLSKYLEEPRWHLVIQFFAGLLPDKVKQGKLSEDCYNCFSERISADPTDWTGRRTRDVLLMIKCLYELQDAKIMASSAGKVVSGEEHRIAFKASKTCQVFPADCTALSHFLLHIKNLRRLELSDHSIDGIGCRELVKVFTSTCNEVEEVYLSNNRIIDEGVKGLSEALTNENCKLTSINLRYNEIGDVGVAGLSEALKNEHCKLTRINLDYNEITDEGVKDLSEGLKNENCKLTSINLDRNNIIDAGVKDLSEALKNENCKLTSIDLDRNNITDAGLKDFSEALKNENCKLTTISLYRNEITDKGFKDLCEALKNENCKVTTISLYRNEITDKGFKDLSEALKNENCKLTSINLRNNKVSDVGVAGLSEALKNENCKLTSINLEGITITDAGIKDLSEALKNENCKLTSISLKGIMTTDAGVKDLSEALKNENCKLTSINLDDIVLSHAGVKDLSEALKNENCKLTSIILDRNTITDACVKDLSEALKNENCKLIAIHLGDNMITDEGVKVLSEALKNENCKLTYISLYDNEITDKGFKDLSEALKNESCKLTIIHLRYNLITDQGVKILREALKNEKNCKLVV